MSKVKIQGHASGTGVLTVTAPNTSTDRTITLPDATGTLLTADGDGSSLTGVGVDGISSSADATAITIDSSERVGVGTASPTEKLQVHGAIRSTNNATTTLADSGNFYYIPTADDASNPRTVISAVGTSSVGGHVTFKTGTSSSNTEKLRIQSGGGISFNGDTAAANALDDYEEGTWTPTFNGNHIGSHTLNYAFYTKIGRLVKVEAYVYNFGSITGSGVSFGITGLPFAPDGQSMGATTVTYTNVESTCSNITARQYIGTVYIEQTIDSNTSIWTSYDKFNANSHVQISLSYTTAA